MPEPAVASPYRPPAVKPLAPPLRPPRYEDVVLGTVPLADGTSMELRFDIYQRDDQVDPGPCIVYFFGGGWIDGDYKQRTSQKAVYARDLIELTDRGLTVVSASYRLVHEAPFPACIHDAKGIIRHLKANADTYRIDRSRIGVLGNSAGGHLSAMVALSSNHAELEGNTGGNLDESSDVAACAIYYAPADLMRFARYSSRDTSSTEVDHVQAGDTADFIGQLFGYDASNHEGRSLAEVLAQNSSTEDEIALEQMVHDSSPINYVRADAPPMLVLHGGQDPVVPAEQSELLVAALTDVGADVTYLNYSLGSHGPSLGPAVDSFAYEFLISRI